MVTSGPWGETQGRCLISGLGGAGRNGTWGRRVLGNANGLKSAPSVFLRGGARGKSKDGNVEGIHLGGIPEEEKGTPGLYLLTPGISP